jgi:hypothetical protein
MSSGGGVNGKEMKRPQSLAKNYGGTMAPMETTFVTSMPLAIEKQWKGI